MDWEKVTDGNRKKTATKVAETICDVVVIVASLRAWTKVLGFLTLALRERARVRAVQHTYDTLQNRLHITQNLIVPKAQNPIALPFNESSSTPVCFGLLRMVAAIEFNHQATLYTTKVSYERANRVLAAKFSAAQLAVTQTYPKFFLRVGYFSSQLTSVNLLMTWIR